MNVFQRHRYGKIVKQLLQEAQHAHNMREDVAPVDVLNRLSAARKRLIDAWASRTKQDIEDSAEELSTCTAMVYPRRSFPRVRENVEILVVALSVAMAFRTYFVQPFKIPTGSMQPTLYGITYAKISDNGGSIMSLPLRALKLVLFGQRPVSVRAKVAGYIEPQMRQVQYNTIIYINGIAHEIHRDLAIHFTPGQHVEKGYVLASGIQTFGDHIFVDKIRYNFFRPKRGDIIVFDTSHISHPDIRPNTFYIKRCAGLPGEECAVEPPYLIANGKRITEPYPFWRLINEKENGYLGLGYTLANPHVRTRPLLGTLEDRLKLAADEYLPLGDNTEHSLDGRYFGGVQERDLVGPAFAIYWPLSRRAGRVE